MKHPWLLHTIMLTYEGEGNLHILDYSWNLEFLPLHGFFSASSGPILLWLIL